MKESALRDLIAQKISQLKPGLTLLQKEQYIPGEHEELHRPICQG